MEFQTDISSLSDEDLERYKHFLLDQIWCRGRQGSVVTKILDRCDLVREEQVRRGLKEPLDEMANQEGQASDTSSVLDDVGVRSTEQHRLR